MLDRSSPLRTSPLQQWVSILALLGLVPILLMPDAGLAAATESGTSNQCVACHTDGAKLKALTPPDPPLTEAGEG